MSPVTPVAQHMSADMQTLRSCLEGQRVAMLTTVDDDGLLRSKPMHLIQQDAEGSLWFFCEAPVGRGDVASPYRSANLAFSDEGATRYVSISCRGAVVRDRATIHALWTPMAKPWFPEGPDAPDLACLRFEPQRAEIWSGPGNGITQALALAASMVTGRPVGMGEHQVLEDLPGPAPGSPALAGR